MQPHPRIVPSSISGHGMLRCGQKSLVSLHNLCVILSTLCQYVAHGFSRVAGCTQFPFFVSQNVSPVLSNFVGSVHCFVQELLDDQSDNFSSSVLPYCGVSFDLSCYLLYGHLGKLRVSL